MVFKCREENAALKECLTIQWVFCSLFCNTQHSHSKVCPHVLLHHVLFHQHLSATLAGTLNFCLSSLHSFCEINIFCLPPATRTLRFSSSVSRSTSKRNWSLRGQGSQQRTGNKNSQLACNEQHDTQIPSFKGNGAKCEALARTSTKHCTLRIHVHLKPVCFI